MQFTEYQAGASRTAVYPRDQALAYLACGLASEAGEVAGKIKKFLRGDHELPREALLAELGDCLWYLAMLATECDGSLDEVARENLAKLASRAERGRIRGDGDDR
ncbi:MAG: nucleoside triphosphate pyrophosphohydrolase family protein [Planctomycetes bacterium]|nr:nucleoside triphosphate pyrophosphohydrolase family protein [Planctomycetota bacterium]